MRFQIVTVIFRKLILKCVIKYQLWDNEFHFIGKVLHSLTWRGRGKRRKSGPVCVEKPKRNVGSRHTKIRYRSWQVLCIIYLYAVVSSVQLPFATSIPNISDLTLLSYRICGTTVYCFSRIPDELAPWAECIYTVYLKNREGNRSGTSVNF